MGEDQKLLELLRDSKSFSDGTIKIEDVDEQLFAKHLYTHGQNDPDLIIRTAGEKRLSNFYFGSLLIVSCTLSKKIGQTSIEFDLIEALNHYKSRKRNMAH